MQPGPPPKPTALRLYEGSRSHRPPNDREPMPVRCEPEMPKHLDAQARREWRRLAPLLLSMRVLSEADGIALGILCTAYSTLIAAQKLMLKSAKGSASGLLTKTPSGYIMPSPLLQIVNQQAEIVNRQLQQFGMSPSSRTRVQTIAADGGVDRLEQLLCGDF